MSSIGIREQHYLQFSKVFQDEDWEKWQANSSNFVAESNGKDHHSLQKEVAVPSDDVLVNPNVTDWVYL